MDKKKTGKKPMTPEQKQARANMLKNESTEARTKRVINPRLKNLLRQLDIIVSSASSNRYTFTDEQQAKILSEIQNRLVALESAFKKTSSKKEIKDLL